MKRPRTDSGKAALLPTWRIALAAGLFSLPTANRAAEISQSVVSPSATTLIGYVDTSVMWRFGESSDSGATKGFPNTLRSPGRLYDVPAKNNGFNLNAVSLVLDKPLQEATWSAGYRVQVLAGPDFPLRNAYALSGASTDVGLNEAYVSLRAPLGNGLDFRLGYFTSLIGYEVYDSYRNPNFSRSYGYFIEPKAHTGLTIKYDFTPWLSAMVGAGNNYSPFIDARTACESCKTYLALLTVTGAGCGHPDASLSFGYTEGNTATAAPTDSSPRIHNFFAGARLPLPVSGLAIGIAYDYQANAAAGVPATFFEPAGPTSTYANATALYLDYKIEKWTFNTRFEYASGTAGNSIFGSRGSFGSAKPLNGPNNEEFLGVTATAGYQLWQNVLSRLEFRWDHDLSGGPPVFGSAAHPRRNSYTLALNVVYMF
jgi:hypothetical protein